MPEPLSQTLQSAVDCHLSGKLVEAERGYRDVLERGRAEGSDDPEVTGLAMRAAYNLGALLLDTGRTAEGVPYLKQAHERVPGDRSLRIAYGVALLRMGRVTEAAAIVPADTSEKDGLAPGTKLDVLARQLSEGMAAAADHLLDMLNLYSPGSAGDKVPRLELALVGANRLPMLLAQLAAGDRFANGAPILPIESVCRDAVSQAAAERLAATLNAHGSDKARPNAHNYHHLYGFILREPNAVTATLEIGMGTNNVDVVSNMSSTGRPGASLRAFRDFLPRARVYGADVDKRILFTEERIETFFVDQTDQLTFDVLDRSLPYEFDLIIDDGLHSPDANLTVLLFALPKIKRGGWFVVEDIKQASLPVWRTALALLPAGYAGRIVKARLAYMFVVQRLADGAAFDLDISEA